MPLNYLGSYLKALSIDASNISWVHESERLSDSLYDKETCSLLETITDTFGANRDQYKPAVFAIQWVGFQCKTLQLKSYIGHKKIRAFGLGVKYDVKKNPWNVLTIIAVHIFAFITWNYKQFRY